MLLGSSRLFYNDTNGLLCSALNIIHPYQRLRASHVRV